MPPGAPFNSLILPYNIRVDEFTDVLETPPQLHLLSHTHTDHLAGLASKSFGSTTICSRDAKEMLLRHEVYGERDLHDSGLRTETTRTFSHLKIAPVRFLDGSEDKSVARDLLRTLPLEEPTNITLSNDERITLTLFDANHCPGAVMFLIEGSRGAVLHTGDIRAEPSFISKLRQNRHLRPYFHDTSSHKTLKAIYLDTACMLSNNELPTKVQATDGLVELLKMYPDNVSFFINSWTWGYEDILKAVAKAFHCKIHVDRYKYSVYMHTSDNVLKSILTRNPKDTRFHACERFDRCDEVAVDGDHQTGANTSRTGRQVVYINPVTMDATKWTTYVDTTKELLSRGELLKSLLVGLSRHSSRPELAAFVSLFRPENVVPNTLSSDLLGYDHLSLHRMFAHCLSPQTDLCLHPKTPNEIILMDKISEVEDTAVLNIVGGEDVSIYARRWADCGGLVRKFRVLKEYLSTAEEKTLKLRLPPIISAALDADIGSEDRCEGPLKRHWNPNDSDNDSDDERGRMASFLFDRETPSFASTSSPLAAVSEPEENARHPAQRPVTPPNLPDHYALLTPESSPTFMRRYHTKSEMYLRSPLSHHTPISAKRNDLLTTMYEPSTPSKLSGRSQRPLKRQRSNSFSNASSTIVTEPIQSTADSPSIPASRKLRREIPSSPDLWDKPSAENATFLTLSPFSSTSSSRESVSSQEQSKRPLREERRAKRKKQASLIAERMSQSWTIAAPTSSSPSITPSRTIINESTSRPTPLTRESTWIDENSQRTHTPGSASTSGSRIASGVLKRLRCTSSVKLEGKSRR